MPRTASVPPQTVRASLRENTNGTPIPATQSGRGLRPRASAAPPIRQDPRRSSSPPSDRTTTPSQQDVPTSGGRRRRQNLPGSEELAPTFLNQKRKRQQNNNPPIQKNTRAQLKVATLNIKGRGAESIRNPKHKWHDIHRMMFDKKIGVLAVTETHLSSAQAMEIQDDLLLGKRLKVFNSIDVERPNSKGVAIVLNKDITNVEGVKIRRLIPGRAILAVLPWHGKLTLTILAVYAPADSMAENAAFWDKLTELWLSEDLPVPDMLLGDANVVEDAIDRFPHRTDDPKATQALGRFKQLIEIKDGWRLTNPDQKAYTYKSTSGKSHSRLDRIMVSPDLFKKCRYWEISDTPGELTDHKLVSATVCAPGAPFIGPGRYVIPLYLLKDKKFINYTVEQGAKLLNEPSDEEIQVRYKKYKDDIVAFARERAKESVGATEQKKLGLQKAVRLILNPPPDGDTDVSDEKQREDAVEVAKLQTEINVLMSRQRARNRLATKIRY
ncbi:Endonuclease/exonuclease/phosphatase, partial [Mycena filopes]